MAVAIVVAPAAAQTVLVPPSGTMYLHAEIISYNTTDTGEVVGAKQVRGFTIGGYADKVYPFFTEHIGQDTLFYYFQIRRLYMSATDYYRIHGVGASIGCVKDTFPAGETPDDVQLWSSLQKLLNPADAQSGFSTTSSGIDAVVETASAQLTIPTSVAGNGVATQYTATYTFSGDKWHMGPLPVRRYPLRISLRQVDKNADGNHAAIDLTFVDYGLNTLSAVNLTAPASCTSDGGESSSEEETANTTSTMPEFPTTFTAMFRVTMPREKVTFTVREAFSDYSRTSHTTMQPLRPDTLGRVASTEWYVDGKTQMAYFIDKEVVPDGNEVIDPKFRQYFLPDKQTCRRAVIGYELVPTTVASLLLRSPRVPPTFIGNQTVRGMRTGVWTALVDGVRVTYYWADSDANSFSDNEGNSWSPWVPQRYSRLVRMVVEGVGAAGPLFAHHPFYPKAEGFPEPDRSMACRVMMPHHIDMGCDGLTVADGTVGDYLFIYDLVSFTSYVGEGDADIPALCNRSMSSFAFPGGMCYSSGVIPPGAIVVLLIVVGLLAAMFAGCCVWCRFASITRGLQEDIISLAQEMAVPRDH